MGRAEGYVENYLRRRCEKNKFLCYKFTSPGRAGVPDDIVIGQGKTIFVECKSSTGTLQEIQKYVIKEMKRRGATVYVCSTRDEIDEMFNTEFREVV